MFYISRNTSEENVTIGHTAYSCPWYNEPVVVQTYFLGLILQSQRKATITAGRFYNINIVTFAQTTSLHSVAFGGSPSLRGGDDGGGACGAGLCIPVRSVSNDSIDEPKTLRKEECKTEGSDGMNFPSLSPKYQGRAGQWGGVIFIGNAKGKEKRIIF
uniref:Uncharacterized protein n=1 Tax=Anopheles atroparvus TaxID=41427 RepID=A0A182ILT8_ANOAO